MLDKIFKLTSELEFLIHLDIVAQELEINTKSKSWTNFKNLLIQLNPVEINGKVVYHNWIHIVYSTLVSYYLAKNDNIAYEDLLHLFFAMLFHDIGHTCGIFHNNVNIEIAKSYCENILSSNFLHDLNKNFYIIRKSIIKDLIDYTNNKPDDSKYNVVKYIKDADLTMSLSALSEQFCIGLNNELNTSFYTHQNMLQFAKSQFIHTKLFKDIIGTV